MAKKQAALTGEAMPAEKFAHACQRHFDDPFDTRRAPYRNAGHAYADIQPPAKHQAAGGGKQPGTRGLIRDASRASRKQFGNAQAMLGKSASVGEVAGTTGLTRQTVYRIKDDPAWAQAALATWCSSGAPG